LITTIDAAPSVKAIPPVVLTIDTTVANYWDATLDWSVAHADNEAAAMSGFVVRVA
jgi:acyl dehydratase